MSTRFVILGLLKDKPLHGYEIKQLIEEHMGDWTNIAFGSIYFALDKLKTEGLVEKISEEKVGNRPSRSIYQITEKGKNEFLAILRGIWNKYDRQYFPIDIAIAFSKSLPVIEIKKYIDKRIENLNNNISYLKKHKTEQLQNPKVPKIIKAVFSHTEYHLKAELEWLKSTSEDFNRTK
jgi:DNA-binding PadR family transcriptional regulator